MKLSGYLSAFGLLRALQRPRCEQRDEANRAFRRLVALLYEHNDYYRDMMDRRHVDPKNATLSDFPVIGKSDVQTAGASIITRGHRPVTSFHTSGTSRRMGEIHFDQQAMDWVETINLFNFLTGARKGTKHLFRRSRVLGVIPLKHGCHSVMKKTPFFIANLQYHDITAPLVDIVDTFLSFRPDVLHAYPSVLLQMAEYMTKKGLRPPRNLTQISSYAENLDRSLETFLTRFYGVPIINFYATTETLSLAKTCKNGRMHLTLPTLIICEIAHDGVVTSSGTGDLVVTNLYNHCMPLVRYNLEDCVTIDEDMECSCGWTTPILTAIRGRSSALVHLPDGRTLSGAAFFPLTDEIPELLRYQILLLEGKVVCRSVFAPDCDREKTKREVEAHLRRIVGDGNVDVRVEETTSEALASQGKAEKRPLIVSPGVCE